VRKKLLWTIPGIIAALVLLIVGLNLFAAPAPSHVFFQQFDQYPLVIAHADDTGLGIAPGDTLLFLEVAAEMGVDILEMNVHMSADGQIVLIHDDSVERTTNGSGKISEMSLAEIQALEVGVNWTQDEGQTYPYRGAGLRIPTLEEVFKVFPDYPMNIEIKAESPEAGERLCAIIDQYGMTSKVLVASSRDAALEAFRQACPAVATSAHTSEVRQFVLLSYAFLSNPLKPAYQAFQVPESSSGITIMRPSFVNAAQRRDIQVQVWTVDDPAEMQRYIEMGVDGILTNKPAELMRILGK